MSKFRHKPYATASRVLRYVFMTVQDLRVNAVQLLARALEAGNRGQFTAAEQLTALAAQYFDDANLIEVAERQPITKGAG